MHIVLINLFYPPASAPTGLLLRELARVLSHRGHRVTIVASSCSYNNMHEAPESARQERIDVLRVGPSRTHRTDFLSKSVDYIRFYPAAYRAIARLKPAPDAIVSMTTPPFCALIARWLWRRRGIPYCIWCMDLYPDAFFARYRICPTHLIARILAAVARRERQDAEAVITLGPDMTERVRKSSPTVQIAEIPVWAHCRTTADLQQEIMALRRERGWADTDIVLMYSGHMGRAHSISKFVELARQAMGCSPRIRVVVGGVGPALAEWKAEGKDYLEWLESVANRQLASHLLTADVHLISQKPGWEGIVVPSKYQSACLLGRPVVFDGPAESAIAHWIREGDTGWILPDDQSVLPAGILDRIRDRELIASKGKNARLQANQLFDHEINTMKIVRLLEEIGSRGG